MPERNSYDIVLVCDAQRFLMSRKLDLYRFFARPPRIILVRRGAPFPTDPRISVEGETIHLPAIGFEQKKIASTMLAALSSIGYLLNVFVLAFRLRWKKVKPQIVHAHFIFPQGLLGFLLSRIWRVPLFISAVGSDANVLMRANAAMRKICCFLMTQAYVTIAVSRPLQRVLQQFGIENAIYVPNSIDTSSICPTSRSPTGDMILFVGAMTENKRPLLLLRAFERVVSRVPTARLTMCGDGPLRETLETSVLQGQLQDKVRVFPQATSQFVMDLLSQASVFVLPSRHEGLSHALLEAMAAGKVIVASSNESHNEMFRSGRDALLFGVDDEEKFAELLILALTDEEIRSALSRSARQLCLEQFSLHIVAPRVEAIYLKALGRSAANGTR